MEKTELTALDLKFLVRELKDELIGGMFRKIYQYGRSKTKQFLLEIFVPGKGAVWLYVDSQKMFMTRRKKAVPQEPPGFCMFLRKHLMGKRIMNVKQHDFDRIAEIHTKENVLVFELFHPGNVILCDSSFSIIMPLEVQRWRDREIRPKVPYRYPPKPSNPFETDLDSLRRSLAVSGKKLIAYMASNMGFGAVYASEICARAGIDGDRITTDLGLREVIRLHQAMESLGSERMDSRVYGGSVSPFPLRIYSDQESESFGSFSEALDGFFSEQQIETAREEVKKVAEEKKERVERIVRQQEMAVEEWKETEKDSRGIAERIYEHYPTVEGVLNGIRKAKDSGMSWKEIKQKVESEDTPEAGAIKEIRENEGIVVLDLGGMEIEIDIRKSVEENAADYYEGAKSARRKSEGAGEAMGKQKARLEEAQKEVEKHDQADFSKEVFPVEKRGYEPAGTPGDSGTPPENKHKRKRRKWYEKFKWFHSSDGFLVVAGRDASQNEMLLKKHADSSDPVFHADIAGAAFVIVKSEGKDVPSETMKEAAEFAAANSKAWTRGLGNIDIYSVPRERVTKTPPSGEYLPKGSFMITGEREWYRDMELKLAVGVKVDQEEKDAGVLSGPVMAMRKNCDYFVTIRPGFKKSMELAGTIRNRILIKSRPEDKQLIEDIPLDEFQVVIPSGMGDVVEYVDRDYI
jgi:predicted ribosome quality control (RQC) complex YloA/Tae2 family protein